jgi:hypothetical protein
MNITLYKMFPPPTVEGNMIPTWILAVGIIVLVLGTAYGVRNHINSLLGFGGGKEGSFDGKPTMWWILDDSQRNARHWLDWGDRSDYAPNEPYLQLCQQRAQELWGAHFTIQPLVGRLAVHRKLEEAGVTVPDEFDRCPPALWSAWCRAAYLSKFGGVWMDGSVLPVGSGLDFQRRVIGKDIAMFGVDPDEGLSVAESTAPAAGRSAGWSAVPNHPIWAGIERDIRALILEGDQSWGAPEASRALRTLWDKHCAGIVKVDRTAEISRDRYGRRLEMDTLFGETDWPTGSTKGGLWVSLPDGRDGLERSSSYAWFMRLSKEQIAASDFVWAKWATKTA